MDLTFVGSAIQPLEVMNILDWGSASYLLILCILCITYQKRDSLWLDTTGVRETTAMPTTTPTKITGQTTCFVLIAQLLTEFGYRYDTLLRNHIF